MTLYFAWQFTVQLQTKDTLERPSFTQIRALQVKIGEHPILEVDAQQSLFINADSRTDAHNCWTSSTSDAEPALSVDPSLLRNQEIKSGLGSMTKALRVAQSSSITFFSCLSSCVALSLHVR